MTLKVGLGAIKPFVSAKEVRGLLGKPDKTVRGPQKTLAWLDCGRKYGLTSTSRPTAPAPVSSASRSTGAATRPRRAWRSDRQEPSSSTRTRIAEPTRSRSSARRSTARSPMCLRGTATSTSRTSRSAVADGSRPSKSGCCSSCASGRPTRTSPSSRWPSRPGGRGGPCSPPRPSFPRHRPGCPPGSACRA